MQQNFRLLLQKKYNLVSYISIAAILFIAVKIQLTYDAIVHPQSVFTFETRYILPEKVVRNFSFGFRNLLADLYWVKAVQDFSIWDGTDPFYAQEYKNIAALDPKFAYPYILGILTFTSSSADNSKSNSGMLLTIEPVIQTGIENLPDNWEIPFYMGTGFQITKNTEKALYYLKLASSHENAPQIVRDIYKTFLKNTITGKEASGKAMSKDLLRAMYETTNSNTTKKMLEDGIRINDLIAILENVNTKYYKQYGTYPSSLNDLVNHNIIASETRNALLKAYKVSFNPYNGKVSIIARKVN